MKKIYHQFKRILIANRGEIAVRIMKTANEMGIETVAIYTAAEEASLHVEKANIKSLLQGNTLHETYLNSQQIIELAKKNHAEAIHPGYGFLSENKDFAKLCENNNIVFIGPSAKNIELMGDKKQANQIASECGVPILKKLEGSVEIILKQADKLQYPLLIKASAGGGGKGMRIVNKASEIKKELEKAAAEALRYFGNDAVYVEQYIEESRHIEVQVLGDNYGNIVHLYERDCSIQRRHQKVIEEAPAPNLPELVREKILNDALKLVKHINYKNAGTLEFLLTPDFKHYFLEMNTRIQVEHPVTEQITGIDIVKEQINIAAGHSLPFSQDQINLCGHAIEARIYAEDPSNEYQPSFGKIKCTHVPHHPYVRIDGGALPKENLNPSFDPLLKKVISYGKDRNECIDRMRFFLEHYALFGVQTNRNLILQTINDADFVNERYSTSFLSKKKENLLKSIEITESDSIVLSAAYILLKKKLKLNKNTIWHNFGHWRINENYKIKADSKWLNIEDICSDNSKLSFTVNHHYVEINQYFIEQNSINFIINNESVQLYYWSNNKGVYHIQFNGVERIISDIPEKLKTEKKNNITLTKTLKAPMPGRIIDILVKEGDKIKEGSSLMVLEAMKTENNIKAWTDLVITKVEVAKGQHVSLDQLLLEIE